jgi:hypothetical protein
MRESSLNWSQVIIGGVIAIATAVLLVASSANAACEKMCNPEKSRPCGRSCISKYSRCTKPTTTTCVGVAEDNKVNYTNPKKVEPEVLKESGT